MKVYLATDHAGFKLKEALKVYLLSLGYEVDDAGAYALDPDDDYPDFVIPAARKVAEHPGSRGIVLGGSGQGEAMAANKVKGIRAAVYYGGTEDIVRLSREHNNANVLALGARFLSEEGAIIAVNQWLKGAFEGGRHARRIKKMEEAEK